MKPKPISRMHAPTSSAPSSMFPPSASSTSAEPHWLVAERFPCFATRQPAPAAMNAAVVETLNVGRPPPVPAVSTRPSPASTFTARSRSADASPAISPTVSPFVRRAMRKAAACASDAFPSMISFRTAAAVVGSRSSWPARRSIASVSIGLGIREEVAQQLLAVRGEHRLGVELHALDGELAVAQPHDHLARARGHLELVRQLGVDDERVVAAHDERRFEAREDRPAVVLRLGGLAVHRLAAHDRATVGGR